MTCNVLMRTLNLTHSLKPLPETTPDVHQTHLPDTLSDRSFPQVNGEFTHVS